MLVTEQVDVDKESLRRQLRADGLTELAVPRRILTVAEIPVLGSGKIDYKGARLCAMEEAAPVEPPVEVMAEKRA